MMKLIRKLLGRDLDSRIKKLEAQVAAHHAVLKFMKDATKTLVEDYNKSTAARLLSQKELDDLEELIYDTWDARKSLEKELASNQLVLSVLKTTFPSKISEA